MRTIRALGALTLSIAFIGVFAAPALGQTEVRITTPYPAVSVEAGQVTTFDLTVTAPGRQRVSLEVTENPADWTILLRGGGFVVAGVYSDPQNPPQVQLEVQVPPDAAEGDYQVAIEAGGAGSSDTLTLDLRVAEAVAGAVSLTAEFARLEGPSDGTFTYNLDLANNTPEEITFGLEGAGPPGWQVDARPSGQAQASTITVDGGGTTGITVDVDPPDDTPADTYVVGVRASGSGRDAIAELEVEITGNFALTFSTPDERLNTAVNAGRATDVELVVFNDGSAPLIGVTFSSDPPAEWEVTFTPEIIDEIPTGESASVTATITTSTQAVAGDYLVGMTASAEEASSDFELRTTVETSSLFGFIGLLLIVAAIAGLAWVFQRYGRR